MLRVTCYALRYTVCYGVNVMAGVTGVTLEQVSAAAEAIAAQGDRPSVRAVRDRLGTGSYGTLQKHLLAWRMNRPQAAQRNVEVPLDTLALLSRDTQRHADAQTAELRESLIEAQRETDDTASQCVEREAQVDALTEENDRLTLERSATQSKFEAATSEVTRLTEDLNRERESTREQQQQLATATVKIEVLESQITDLKTDISSVRGELTTAIADRQKAEKETDKALAETALEKHKAAEATDQENKSVQLMQSQLDDLKSEVAQARTDAKEARNDAREARGETKTAHQATAGEAEEWRKTVALEHKRNAELQSERDTLANRLAVLEAPKKEDKDG